nr:two-component regulator propeller domain-containing protein [uncultured Mucilaginibacter sp.]
MKYTCINMLVLMLAFCIVCKGQSKTETKNVSTPHVPYSSVRTIKQDRKGIMWLVTLEGIIRYDGKSFTNITSKLNAHRFWDVLEDRRGNFWFASIGTGVYYYDGKSFKNYTTKDGLPSNSVFKIYEDNAGIIWFGTGEGLSRYDGKSFINLKMNEESLPVRTDSARSVYPKWYSTPEIYWMINQTKNLVNAIVEDQTGKVWFGTWSYAGIYNGKTIATIKDKNGKPFKNVRSMVKDKKGNIWLGGGGGLWRYDGTAFTNFTQNAVGYVYTDKQGNIWTTSQSDNSDAWVLTRYDKTFLSDKKPTGTKIKSGAVGLFGILEAHDGSIWFGASDGVYRYDGKIIKKIW